jgi:hypothetical protein
VAFLFTASTCAHALRGLVMSGDDLVRAENEVTVETRTKLKSVPTMCIGIVWRFVGTS